MLNVTYVLDPQYKCAYLDFSFKKMYYYIDQASILSTKLREAMIDLFNEYKRLGQPSMTQRDGSTSTQLNGSSNLTNVDSLQEELKIFILKV